MQSNFFLARMQLERDVVSRHATAPSLTNALVSQVKYSSFIADVEEIRSIDEPTLRDVT